MKRLKSILARLCIVTVFFTAGIDGAFCATTNLPDQGDVGDYGSWATPNNRDLLIDDLQHDMSMIQDAFNQNQMVADYVPIEAKIGLAFMNAMSAYDLEEMCAYMQKEDRAIFEAEIKMLGLAGDFTNSLISEAIGIDLGFDFSDLLGGTSGYAALYEMLGGELPKFERIHVESITYVRGEEDDIVKKNPFDFLELQKVLCKKAYVQVSGTYDGQAFNDTILMVREGFGDWKVSHESLGSADFLGLEQMYEQIQ